MIGIVGSRPILETGAGRVSLAGRNLVRSSVVDVEGGMGSVFCFLESVSGEEGNVRLREDDSGSDMMTGRESWSLSVDKKRVKR